RKVLERRQTLLGSFDDRTIASKQHLLLVELHRLFEFNPRPLFSKFIGSGAERDRVIGELKKFKEEMVAHFGADHPHSIYAAYFLGMGYRMTDRLDEALKEWDEVSKITLGAKIRFRIDHPDVETAIQTHANAL